MRSRGSIRATLILCLTLLTFGAEAQAQKSDSAGVPVQYRTSVTKYLMGTRVEGTVVHTNVSEAQAALLAAFREMERIEALMGRDRPGSDVDRINESAGRAVVVSAETMGLLVRAHQYSARTSGLFDVTSAVAADRWGFGQDSVSGAPDQETVARLARSIDYRKIALDRAASTVRLLEAGMLLDLGGVAKGYAVDQAAAQLRLFGVVNFLINAGGDLLASGEPEAGRPWRVGIQHPRDANELIARLEIRNGAVATSGDYERFVEWDGIKYPHIIDPRTARPSMERQSASVVAATAEEADALATYLFISGAFDGLDAAMLVTESGEIETNLAGSERFSLVW